MYEKFAIRGARNFFASKDKSEQAWANEKLENWLCAGNVVWDGGSVGVMVGNVGYGTATVKKLGSVPITIE